MCISRRKSYRTRRCFLPENWKNVVHFEWSRNRFHHKRSEQRGLTGRQLSEKNMKRNQKLNNVHGEDRQQQLVLLTLKCSYFECNFITFHALQRALSKTKVHPRHSPFSFSVAHIFFRIFFFSHCACWLHHS